MFMPTVLVVDDDTDNLILTKKAWQDSGEACELELVNSGKACINYLSNNPLPALVLVDVNMPGMGGIELLSVIKSKYPHLPVVMLTSMRDQKIINKCYKQGANAYLIKPFAYKNYAKLIKVTCKFWIISLPPNCIIAT